MLSVWKQQYSIGRQSRVGMARCWLDMSIKHSALRMKSPEYCLPSALRHIQAGPGSSWYRQHGTRCRAIIACRTVSAQKVYFARSPYCYIQLPKTITLISVTHFSKLYCHAKFKTVHVTGLDGRHVGIVEDRELEHLKMGWPTMARCPSQIDTKIGQLIVTLT
jgi:hypothetical protein